MLKDTSLVSVLAISDILRVGNEYATKHFNYFETYPYIAVTYLVLTLLMSRFVIYLEEDSIFTSSDSVNWWFCRF